MKSPSVAIHWFRRDLRLHDNHGLYRSLKDHGRVLPLFIFDTTILDKLEDRHDRRVDLIHRTVLAMRTYLEHNGASMLVMHGEPLQVWREILDRFDVRTVTVNHDHEPYAIGRDRTVADLLRSRGIELLSYKDISIFERGEVVKDNGGPYTVFTPYMRKWKERFETRMLEPFPCEELTERYWHAPALPCPTLNELGFEHTDLAMAEAEVPDSVLRDYHWTRDLPALEGTSRMSSHLRFGTVSIRALMRQAMTMSSTYTNELIWREFFMQVLWHHPYAGTRAIKPAYDSIPWRNNEEEFKAWCEGRTGYPLVDAGMRELLATGLMHNRVRMVAASFLTKHLLIDWRWGEAWFAAKLLDFELSSNNGGWQWASGSGCDAAPYFRIFNPHLQLQRFDPQLKYVKRWVPEHGSANYMQEVVVHEVARERALEAYKLALKGDVGRTERQPNLFS
ncbi:MAG: deoxyribodipyrimidine photo-lyase [Flavobacteriales bacterium]|nr:deoxyribodipyrimidine photo-lyase [Flavobacteriales bacterium]MBP6696392.1 deoxyribodipyrimidine photo-lyase [Flavobacteriales bacterium]